MAEIKLKVKHLQYFEESWRFVLDVNGKKVCMYKYSKQDPEFGDYDNEVGFLSNKELLDEDEQEEVLEYVEDLEWETEVEK